MGKQLNKKITPHTEYEDTLIWMSYRYAIGRHTIHAHCHGCDIISNEYERYKLTPQQMEFTSKDMNRSIEDILRISFDIYMHHYNQELNIHPLEEFIKAIIDDEGYVKYDIDSIERMTIDFDYKGNPSVDIKLGEHKDYKFLMNDIEDLMIWYYAAKLFDMSTHKTITLIDNSECEYIELYDRIRTSDNKDKFIIRKVPVDSLVKNPHILPYIPDEAIKR